MRGTNYAAILHTNETKPIGERHIYTHTHTLLVNFLMKKKRKTRINDYSLAAGGGGEVVVLVPTLFFLSVADFSSSFSSLSSSSIIC